MVTSLTPAQRDHLERLRREQNPGKYREQPRQQPLWLPLEERLPQGNPSPEQNVLSSYQVCYVFKSSYNC